MFLRPCFLVVDREFAGSISTRKLAIETATFNVITAYHYTEAIATLEQFSTVHAVAVTVDKTVRAWLDTVPQDVRGKVGEAEAFLMPGA